MSAPTITSTSQTSKVDQVANGTYYYAVSAVNSVGESSLSSVVSATTTTSTHATITISGTILYQDKEYGVNGFTANQPYKAVRYATVELVSGATISSTLTDADGLYSITTGTVGSSYIRVTAEATLDGANSEIVVKNLSNFLFSFRSSDFIAAGNATVNISVPTTSIGGAFNILDVFTNGLQYVHSLSGAYPSQKLIGIWGLNNCDGTWFDGTQIVVLNDPGACPGSYGPDSDEYDDDVLYHEFGHFIAANFSKDDSPGGMHMLSNNDLDMRLSWSEGWGDSMPGQIKTWLFATSQQNLLSSANGVSLSQYVDTYGNAAFSVDMGNPTNPELITACNEVAVAKILLDLNNQVGSQNVWDAIASFPTTTTPVNLELFWDRWNSLESASTTTLSNVFAARSVNYSDLATNTTFSTAAPVSLGTSTIHNLYPAGDADFFSLSALQGHTYTVTTSNLKNGADTLISVFDSNKNLVNSVAGNPNDNANNTTYSGTSSNYPIPSVPSDSYLNLCDNYGVCHDNGFDILGSRVIFTAQSNGTYYIVVQSSGARPVSAGRYGTYTLTVQ